MSRPGQDDPVVLRAGLREDGAVEAGAAASASAAVAYGASLRRVAMVGGIISSSPLSYEAAASDGRIHTVRSASVEALRVRWPVGSAATKNQVS